MNLPPPLKQNDTIAIVSPSWGGPSIFPQVYHAGIQTLKQLGMQIKEYPTARMSAQELYENPKARAQDINDAFADPKVKAIIATIGGDDSVRILPYLNKTIIKKNPKIVMGYSDTTTVLTFCNQLGIITYHGPCVMAGLAQWNNLPQQYQQHVTNCLFHQQPYTLEEYKTFSQGYQDWNQYPDKLATPVTATGYQWMGNQQPNIVKGQLFGGCIEVLEMIKGTSFWPKKNFWNNKILFLETSEDKPNPDAVKYMLRNYGAQGVLNQINGLLLGRARDYTKEENQTLYQYIGAVCKEYGANIPIVANVDFGHTDPQYILPLGATLTIDYKHRKLRTEFR